jgi:hypothetical protein
MWYQWFNDGGTNNYHRFAMRFVCIIRKLARYGDQLLNDGVRR